MKRLHSLLPATLLAFALFPLCAVAQHELLRNYDWETMPERPRELPDGVNSLLLKRNIISQFTEEGDNVKFYHVFHVQRYLDDAAAVEESKTVELGTGHIHEVMSIKARSMAPDGRITELRPEAFKKATDDRGQQSGIYFAFEGLQPGSIMEYIMVSRQRADLRGDIIRMQFSLPVVEQRYEVLMPDDWVYAFKTYNGLPHPEADTSIAGIIRHHLLLKDVPAVVDENSSNAANYRMYLVQKLDAIPGRNIRDFSGYVGATKIYHGALYPELNNKTKKETAALLKKMKLGFARDLDDRIRTIDRYLHSNFRMAEGSAPELADLEHILRTATCNELGMQRLYCTVLREADIDHQLVLTKDRTDLPFDPEFEAHTFLRDILIYFPESGKFLDPTEIGLGLGYAPPEFMGTHGLFIRNFDLGGAFTGIGSIKAIPALPAEATNHAMKVNVQLSEDALTSKIDLEKGLSGYYARYIQNFYDYMDEEQRKELLHAYVEYFTEGAAKQKIEVENAEARWFGVKPFTIKGHVETSKFTNQAGNEVLLRVGDMIGPQMEMYAEKERKLPLDASFNRYYDRNITIQLPKGWSCDDLAPMEIHKTMEVDGKLEAEFRSIATQKDGVITIEVIEYYRSVHVPLEHFEAYRSVINAAADFNKRTLLLAPPEG